MKRLFILLVLAVAVQCQPCSGPTLRGGEDLGTCTGSVLNGTSCDLICLSGFFQSGSLQVGCLNGIFDYVNRTGNCGVNCTTYSGGPFVTVGTCNMTGNGQTCQVGCASGSTLAGGSTTATCNNGTYTSATAVCAADCTSPYPAGTYITVGNCTSIAHNAVCYVGCAAGTNQTSGATSATCNNGTWVPATAVCQAGCSSPYPAGPYIDGTNCTNLFHGQTCTVGCQPGTAQSGGSTTATCNNGTWTAATAVCQANCGAYPVSGYIAAGTCTNIGHGVGCQVACAAGTSLASGTLNSQCQNGTYTTPTASCRANCTNYPLNFDQDYGTCSSILHSGSCAITCTTGSILASGTYTAGCNNGTWLTASALCGADCTSYPSGNNVSPGTCTTTTHGASCSVGCTPGNGLLSGSFTASCTNGTYNQATAVCGACTANHYSQNNACLNCDPLATSPPGSTNPSACICQAPSIAVAPNFCQVCANNTYWDNSTGTPQCLACASPRLSFFATSISQCYCPPGTQENGTGGCDACLPGYFNPSTNGVCTLCAGGVVTGGGTGCQCLAGQGLVAGACINCTSGFFNPTAGASCQPCPALSVSAVDFQSCQCVNGAYIFQVNPLICSACTAIPGCAVNVSCTSQFNYFCPQCLAGYRTNGALTTCTICPAGTYCLGQCSSCSSCRSSSTSPPASTQPTDCKCNLGYEADTSSPPFCYICTNGYYELNDVCVTCDSNGFATSFNGAYAKENCTCVTGYGDISGLKGGGFPPNLCRRCNDNEFGAPGSGICKPCPPYSTAPPGSSQCSCDSGFAQTTDINGALACQRILYVWTNSSWGICSGTCGQGPAAALGLQYRDVECYAPLLGSNVDPTFCDPAFRPTSTKSCTTTCPAAPTNIVATPYSASALVTFTMPANNFTNVGPCGAPNYDCSETGGYCDNSTGVWFCHLDTHGFLVMSDPDNIYTYSRSGRVDGQQGVLVKGLVNGRRYSFTVRTFADFETDYQGDTIQRRSELSSPSNLVTPQASLNCFGSCVGGTCINGECVCWPGYYGIGCAVTAYLNVTGPTVTTIDILQGPQISITWFIAPTSLRVDVFLYESICRTKDWCYPIYFAKGIGAANGQGSISISPSYLEAGKTYFVRVFISNRNSFWADSSDFVAIDRYCQDPGICFNGGTCFDSRCSCPSGFAGTRCELSLDACQLQSYDCKTYPYSSGLCTLQGVCECILGWLGPKCEYPPNWTLRCLNKGTPENPNDWSGLQRCDCPVPWSGVDCGTCDVKCLNGGTPRACNDPDPENGGYCKCPDLFEGTKCQTPYVSAYLTLDGTNNVGSPPDSAFENWVSNDIYTGLSLTTGQYYDIGTVDVGSNSVRVQVRFYNQQPNSNPSSVASGVFLRDRFVDALKDPNSQYRLETTSGGAALVSNNVPINNPDQNNPDPSPSNSDKDALLPIKIAVPIGGFIVLVILIFVLYKVCSSGMCKRSSNPAGTSSTGDLAMEPTRS